MDDTYCHLCDADPCYCGRNGQVDTLPKKTPYTRGAARELDGRIREFVLAGNADGVVESWGGWLDRLLDRFGHDDRSAVTAAWNRVCNDLQRDWILIDQPGEGPLQSPEHYPDARQLSLDEAIKTVEHLVASGGWSVGGKGLRLWQVRDLIEGSVYVHVYDALHHMKERGHLVTTIAPSGKQSQFWYVKAD